MTLPPIPPDQYLRIFLALSQYPILSTRMRARMRRELFESHMVDPQVFENEVREKAILSQRREGLQAPWEEEPIDIWEMRLKVVRDQITDLYYSHLFAPDHFDKIVREVLQERGIETAGALLSINPEIAPQELLFEQAMTIQSTPEPERQRLEARLRELKVVLIRQMISWLISTLPKNGSPWKTWSKSAAARSVPAGSAARRRACCWQRAFCTP